MGRLFIGLAVLIIGSISVAYSEPHAPLVAFLCNKPAMYQTSSGWVEDRTQDCIVEPEGILDYCKRVFPDKDITNVVESNDVVTIDNWCGFNKTKCHKHNTHTVVPFRCLVGPFQSDALLVPEHCLFDHKHGTQCGRHADWNKTAASACKSHKMKLQDFAMLQPCGTNIFNGVEFVCCPLDSNIPKEVAPYIVEDDRDILGDEEDDDAMVVDHEDNNLLRKPQTGGKESDKHVVDWKPKPVKEEKPEEEAENSVFYQHYIQKSKDDAFLNEHEYFLKARNDLQKHHHDEVTKMMKNWADARQKIADMKVTNPKEAKKMEAEVTERFQKTYEALEQQGMAEKKQLSAIHQQRVDSDLNNKKRASMEHYMDVLANSRSDATQILKALKHYIKMEKKDELHAMNHFKHVHDTDPKGEEPQRRQTIQHLDIIDKRIKQAIEMLKRVPDMEKKIREQIEDYLSTFRELDNAVHSVVVAPPVQAEEELPSSEESDSSEEQKEVEISNEMPETKMQPKKEPKQEWEEIKPGKPFEKQESKPQAKVDNEIYHVPLEKDQIHISSFDDEIDEDENDLPEMQVQHVASNMKVDKMSVRMQPLDQGSSHPVYGSAPTVGIAVAAIAVFVIIVAGVLVLKKRSQERARAAAARGFVEVENTASPEERHVANMQMNGYENPTYRYFETSQP